MEWSVGDEDYVVGFLNRNSGSIMAAVDATVQDAQVFDVYDDLEDVSDAPQHAAYVLNGSFNEFNETRERNQDALSDDLSEFDFEALTDTALHLQPSSLFDYFDPDLQDRLMQRRRSIAPGRSEDPSSMDRWQQDYQDAAREEIEKYREERGDGFIDYQALAEDTETAWTENYGRLAFAGKELSSDW
jgi:hypothetical protein